MQTTVAPLALAAALFAAAPAQATPLSITNPSFESTVLADGANGVGITGWANTTGGAFNPLIGPTGHFTNPIPDGFNTAWLNGGSATQTLPSVLTADTTLTLRVDVGDRRDNVFPGYSVALLAGNTVLGAESALLPSDGFLTSTVSYTALAGNHLLGQPLKIRLTANGIQVNFDNVRLDVSPVPEPSSAAMLLAGLTLVGSLMRRRLPR